MVYLRPAKFLERCLFGPDVPSPLSGGTKRDSGIDDGSPSAIIRDAKADHLAQSTTLDSSDSSASIPIGDLESQETGLKTTAASHCAEPQQSSKHTWNPGLFQTRPVAGLLALVVTIASTFLSFTILFASDNTPVGGWGIPPNVCLAIITAIANTAIALAFKEAAPVSWWYSASRGRRVASLERQWWTTHSVIRVSNNCSATLV